MSEPISLPLFADGIHLNQQELIACQAIAKAIPERNNRARANLAGHRGSLIKGRGMEFAEVRHYQSGDDVRTIDWRVTARTGKAHTKLFVEERERPVIILVDLSASLYFGSSLMLQSVQAAHLAAALGWNAIEHGDKIGALISSETEHIELKPRSRQQGILSLISAMTKVHGNQIKQFASRTTDKNHLAEACQRLQRLAKPGSLIWIVSDGYNINDTCIPPLSELKRHCDIGTFLITDPLRQGTKALPKQFRLPVKDADQERILDRKSYQHWLNGQLSQQNNVAQMLAKLNIETRYIDAAKTLADQMELLR